MLWKSRPNLVSQSARPIIGIAVYLPLVLDSPLSVLVRRREMNAMADTQVALDPSGEIRVSLSPDDFAVAERVGAQRTEEARQARRPGRAGCPPDARTGCYMVPQSQLVRLQQQPSKIAVPRGDLAARNERI
jgi:hypothetical protein